MFCSCCFSSKHNWVLLPHCPSTPKSVNPRVSSCLTSLISELLIDTREPGSSITAGTVPSAGTALPHPRHIPEKAAAASFLTKSPLHPKSERTDSNFPKKVTVRMHLFSSCWHSTLYFIKFWSLCLPAVGQICIRLCKSMNWHNLLQTGINSMAISIKQVWHTVALDALALDSSCSLVSSYWGFLPFVVSNGPDSLKPFIHLPWYLAEHLIYFHKTLESDYLRDLYYLVKHSKNWLVNQTKPGTMEKRRKKEPQMDKQIIQAWSLMPYFLVNEIKN